MRSTDARRYTAERRNGVDVVADEQHATIATFHDREGAESAAARLESGSLDPSTFHWHADPKGA